MTRKASPAKSKPHTTSHGHGATLRAGLQRIWRHYSWWELGCSGLGLFSFIGVVVLLFLPIGKGPAIHLPTDRMPPAGSQRFMQTMAVAMTLPLDHGPAPDVLVDGDDFLKSLLADIDGAKQSIDMMVYIWKDGSLSDRVLAHLERKQRQGVPVRVMFDGYGGLKAPQAEFERLKALGGRVTPFNSLMPLPWTIARAPKRNHRRAIVIDGAIAYTGGWAVDDVWLGHAQAGHWHDVDFRVTGAMAAHLQGSFAEIWDALTGEMLLGERFFPSTRPEGPVPFVALSTSPSPDLFEAGSFILMSLLGATRSIAIETPYFLPDASVRKVLMDKAHAGISVTVLVPNDKTDEKSVRWAGQRIYQELLEAGVKIYEYQPTFSHAKLLIEDGAYAMVGSANLDNRSRKINDEVVLGIADPALARKLEGIYANDLGRAKQITLEDWRKRGPLQHVLEWVSQAFVQQY